MATETEIKLHLNDVSQITEILNDPLVTEHMREPSRQTKMLTRYYDTENWDLYRAGYMLRIRSEEERNIVSLKQGKIDISKHNGLCLRRKWICESPELEGAIDHLIGCGAPEEIASLTEGKPLVNVCSGDFSRSSVMLYMDEGVVVELSLDVGEFHVGEKTAPIQELELEVIFGSLNAVLPFSEALRAKYELEPESMTKYERCFALANGAD